MKANTDNTISLAQRTAMLAIALALASAIEAAGAEISVQNESLYVAVQPDADIFRLTWRESGKVFVDRGRFAHGIKSAKKTAVSDSVWGLGQEIAVEHENGWQSTLRLFPGSPFVHLHTSVRNSGPEAYVSASEEILQFQVDLGVPPDQLRSYGTGFLNPLQDAPGSFSFTAVVDPATRNGVVTACLTHERGSGVFFTEVEDARPTIRARIDFGRYHVDPGQSRQTETLLIGYFEDARLGLEAYADAVAKLYSITLKPQPSVYCTWYHARASNEQKLLANGEFASRHLRPFGFSVVQIDDGWQARLPEGNTYSESQKNFKGVGPVKVFLGGNENFPNGMAYTAQRLREMGLIPGIWFMPFAGTWNNPYFADKQDLFAHWPDGTAAVTRWSGSLLDLSNPKTQAFVRDRVKRIADWGYGYFKLDGMHTGAVTHNVYVNTGYATSGTWLNSQNFVGDQQAGPGAADVATPSTLLADPRMTHIEAYRKGLEIVREAAPDVFILGCNVSQNMRSMGAAFGSIDAMRIGPDNGGAGSGRWNAVMVGPHHGSNLYFLNRRIWYNDPDPIYVRPSNPLHAARLMASWVAVSGSMLTTSYQFSELPDERLDILKRVMPGHEAVARPVDLFESKTARIWLLTDARRNVRRDVIGLFNWKEKEPDTIIYDMGKLGLDPEVTYVAFDYWADTFIEPIRGTLVQRLEPGSCRILAVRSAADHPQLVSTSRHITQGIIDVLDERRDQQEKSLCGRSLVVGGDPYELRIALPQDGSWEVTRVSADGASIKLVSTTKQDARVLINSPESREVAWRLTCRTSQDTEPWVDLFDGKSLNGWMIKCRSKDEDKDYWKVHEGTITAEVPAGSDHDYIWLLTQDEYTDFELALKVQTYSDSEGNSGVQVRSRYDDDAGWLDGPQVDINPPGPWRNGFIYDETRGAQIWVSPIVGKPNMAKLEHAPKGWTWVHADQNDAWNDVRILCRGTQIKTTINSLTVTDYDGRGHLDDQNHLRRNVGLKGHIGLQIHPGGPLRIRFKDIRLRRLKEQGF